MGTDDPRFSENSTRLTMEPSGAVYFPKQNNIYRSARSTQWAATLRNYVSQELNTKLGFSATDIVKQWRGNISSAVVWGNLQGLSIIFRLLGLPSKMTTQYSTQSSGLKFKSDV